MLRSELGPDDKSDYILFEDQLDMMLVFDAWLEVACMSRSFCPIQIYGEEIDASDHFHIHTE